MVAPLIAEAEFLLIGLAAGALLGFMYMYSSMGNAAKALWKIHRKKVGIVISIGDDMLGTFEPGVRTPHGLWRAANGQVFFPDKQSVYRIHGLPAIIGYGESAYTPGPQLVRHIDVIRTLLGKKRGGVSVEEAAKQFAIVDEERQLILTFFKNVQSLKDENIEDYLIFLQRLAMGDPELRKEKQIEDNSLWEAMQNQARFLLYNGLKPEVVAADGKTVLKYEVPLSVKQMPDGTWKLIANWTLDISGYHQFLPKSANPGDVQQIINEEVEGRIAELKRNWASEIGAVAKWVLLIFAVGIAGYILIDAAKGNVQLPKTAFEIMRVVLGI